MWRRLTIGWVLFGFLVGLIAVVPARLKGEEPAEPNSAVPPALIPFAYLIGGWKGTGVRTANKVRGWVESHSWAWAFEKGRPVGLTAELTGNKIFKSLRLMRDAASNRYVLQGIDPSGHPVTFSGVLENEGKSLVLDRGGLSTDASRQRLTLFPNGNLVRYSLWLSERSKGAPQFTRTIEVGLTKAGESFAAGSGGAELPKCVVTGGAATLTASYQGKSYPLCCTGCRDEFNENPEKYIRKAGLRAGQAASSPESPPVATPEPTRPARETTETDPSPAPPLSTIDRAARASTTLRLGQNLEKTGKSAAALGYYRLVVKEYPGTPAAGIAADRIKVLEGH